MPGLCWLRWLQRLRALSEHRGPDLGALEKELVAVFHLCRSPFPSRKLTLRDRRKAFRRLQRIVQGSTDTQLSQLEMKHLVWAAIGAYCFFRGVGERAGFWSREDLHAARFYLLVMQRLLHNSYESHDVIVDCVLAYISEFMLWQRESLALSTLMRPLFAGATGAVMLDLLLDRVQAALSSSPAHGAILCARHIVRVMYGLFDVHDWPPLDERAAKSTALLLCRQAITRLLKMYRKVLRDEHSTEHLRPAVTVGAGAGAEARAGAGEEARAGAWEEAGAKAEAGAGAEARAGKTKRPGSGPWAAAQRRRAARTALRKGFEVTIRRIVEHMANADLILVITYMVEWIFDKKNSEEVVLTFGTVLEHAAMVHVTGTFEETFSEALFSNLLTLVGADSPAISMLAIRVLQHLLDRHNNRREFASPRIFFQDTHFNVHVAPCLAEDRFFLRAFRKIIHSNVMHALLQHSDLRPMQEGLYTMLCLLATEVPCGYSAAVVANLAMNIQAAAREEEDMRTTTKFQLHALVISVMSLLCWLHNAPDFYKYVNKVINTRAEHAPHLNPPLRVWYSFARHHVLFDKAGLFFDEWEVRYCLWMRFKIRHTQIFLQAMGATAPPSPAELAAAAASGQEPALAARVERRTRRQELEPFLPTRDPAYDVAAARGDSLTLENDPRLLELALEEPLHSWVNSSM